MILFKMEGVLINVLLRYNLDAILKIKMAAKIGKIQLGIHPEKSYFGPIYVLNFILLSKVHNSPKICYISALLILVNPYFAHIISEK